ncbi:hypothetical protein Tel_15070 [Candidatus Tenderia electrophaga]|jgi:cytochrome c1|uniref:Cytochrome c1 n=1 Tax=Candidatus Tenderia electrophaga TaxID=1748243 RepID=A0A0S2TGS1_9GAMM|nr:hypothetical protein Tel_15070 [Candidatus Tenderia electrophaga]
MKKLLAILGAVTLLAGTDMVLAAATGTLTHIDVDESNEARQRGAETVISTCLLCHSLKYVKFINLTEIGMAKEDIEFLLMDQGISDRMMSLSPVEVREESYGKVPPDLSLMAIARKNGPDYLYTLLTEYYYTEEGETDNHLFPGIKMPDVLAYADTEPGSAERAEAEAQARDVASFLKWTADPNADTRESIGVYVMIYLVILTALLYLLKRRVWRGVHKTE